ncbi:MAG: hypothetical protein L6R36_002841 [Xanthoria steineri]|nr:MAG: hypothetical protein L6R36_002841 [Xanthoria steineri]
MARHMVHVSETLVVAVQSLQGLKQQQAEFSVQHLQATKLTSTNSQSNFHLQLQLLQSLLARADSNKARLQNEINLAFNAEAQRDSKVQARIGEEARKKTASMKAIAVVTMIFLPSTFVARQDHARPLSYACPTAVNDEWPAALRHPSRGSSIMPRSTDSTDDHPVWPSDAERAKYTIGWIAPMSVELTPALALLKPYTTFNVANDDNIYQAGKIGNHHVVMVTLPKIGLEATSAVATNMYAAFRDLKHLLLVGIGGGIPGYGPGEQIVLGDVVVGRRVEHLDCGSRTPSGFEHTIQPCYPDPALSIAAKTLYSARQLCQTKIPDLLGVIRKSILKDERPGFEDPGTEADRLFNDDYHHKDDNKLCNDCCDLQMSKSRMDRGDKAFRATDSPRIHIGNIGSGNSLVVGSNHREDFYKKFGVICFEMEGAALLQRNPLVIRGICDYSDTHKNKKWQPYAAATAAAYAHELLLTLPAQRQSVNHNRYPAIRMEQEEESASEEDWVPAPSSTQPIENVPHGAELDVPDLQDPQNPYSFPEPSRTIRTQSKLPKSLYDRCQSWIKRPSTPFFHVINASKRSDPLLYEIQSSLASRFMSMTLDEGLPLLAFPCSRSVHLTLDFMLQRLCSQLKFHLSRENSDERTRTSQRPTDLGTFEASLARINRNVSGVFLNLENISANGDQIQRFQNILDSHCARYPLSKFLFLTQGPDERLTMEEKDVHLLQDRKCSQPLGDLKYS